MDVLLLLAPVLAAGLLSVFAVKKHTEQPNEKPGRLPIMILLLLPLTAGATYAYYLGAFFLSFVTDSRFARPWNLVVLVLCMIFMAYIAFLLGRLLARILCLTKKNRLISLAVMLVLMLAMTYASYVYISGNFI